MASYTVTFQTEEKNIRTVKARACDAFAGMVEGQIIVTKIERNQSRSDRLGEAESLIGDAASTVRELAEEMQSWYDNMPENLQGSSKGEEVEACKDALEELADEIEALDFGSIDFPGMY